MYCALTPLRPRLGQILFSIGLSRYVTTRSALSVADSTTLGSRASATERALLDGIEQGYVDLDKAVVSGIVLECYTCDRFRMETVGRTQRVLTDYVRTPLSTAVLTRQWGLVERLLLLGADPWLPGNGELASHRPCLMEMALRSDEHPSLQALVAKHLSQIMRLSGRTGESSGPRPSLVSFNRFRNNAMRHFPGALTILDEIHARDQCQSLLNKTGYARAPSRQPARL